MSQFTQIPSGFGNHSPFNASYKMHRRRFHQSAYLLDHPSYLKANAFQLHCLFDNVILWQSSGELCHCPYQVWAIRPLYDNAYQIEVKDKNNSLIFRHQVTLISPLDEPYSFVVLDHLKVLSISNQLIY